MMKPLLTDGWSALVDTGESIGLRALCAALRRMSWEQVDRLAAAIGVIVHVTGVPRRRVALRNLRTAFGNELDYRDADRLARTASVHFVQAMFQFLRVPVIADLEFRRRVQLVGFEHYERAAAKGRGVVILTAHLGNWEFLGSRLARAGVPLTVLARDRSNGTIDHIMRATREAAWMKVLDKASTMLAVARVLQRNEALGMLVDQHAHHHGIPLPFFGRVTPMHSVVARLARQTGAAVLPCYCVREGEGYVATIYPRLELVETKDRHADFEENTRRMTRVLEAQIRRHPDQWLWVHKRWRDEIDPIYAEQYTQRRVPQRGARLAHG